MMFWNFARPLAWSALRHAVTAAVAYVSVKTGVQISEGTVHDLSSVGLSLLDIGMAAGAGAVSSVVTSRFKREKPAA